MFIECRYWMAVPMSLIISEASINTILEKGHINIPTVTQGHAWECLWLTNSLLEYMASIKSRISKISPSSCVLVLQATIPQFLSCSALLLSRHSNQTVENSAFHELGNLCFNFSLEKQRRYTSNSQPGRSSGSSGHDLGYPRQKFNFQLLVQG